MDTFNHLLDRSLHVVFIERDEMLAYKFRLYLTKEEDRKREGTVGTTGSQACGQPTTTASRDEASRLDEARSLVRKSGEFTYNIVARKPTFSIVG